MSDALARYRMAERQDKDALKRYKDSGAESNTLGALAKYLGLQSYWDRQGRMASQGLQMAEEGANAVRGGDLSGLGGAILGPLGYFSSPINALFPERSEIDAATDVPDWSKPVLNAASTVGQVFTPGPGEFAPAMFLGVMAKNADKVKLAKAMEMESAGASPAVIRGETGWFKGGDEKWRFEISDANATMNSPETLSLQNSYPVGATVRHDELYSNYPELRQIKVHPETGSGGGINLAERELYLGTGADLAPEIRNDYVKSVALHELQHAVQGIEGFAGGAGMSTANRSLNDYRRAAGEVEARNVQRRMNWTDSERRVAPWVTEDVPREQQIFTQSRPFERAYALPTKGLGRGMAQLADDATDAERAALAGRLEAEAAQTGGQASTVGRDQALLNLTEAPQSASIGGMGKFDFSNPGTGGSRTAVIGDTTIDYGVGRDGLVEVILVKTPKSKRGQGSARAAMQTLATEADAAGLRLGLNADPMDKGISKARLEDFYKSLGFKRNAGNKRDFTTRLEYLREPPQ